MAAVQSGDPATLAGVLGRQRAHLLKEMRSLGDARTFTAGSPVVALLITAAELHIRADLGVVDAAEQSLRPELLPTAGPSASAAGATATEAQAG